MTNKKEKQKPDCPGSYEVSGYTTKDGKKVDDYIRRCWKHGGTNSVTNFMGEMPNPTDDFIQTSDSYPQTTSNEKTEEGEIWDSIWKAVLQSYLNNLNKSNVDNRTYNNYSMAKYPVNNYEPKDLPVNFSTFDIKKTEENIKKSMKNTENILKQKIITKEDIAKISNQNQIIMHNLFDDIEDLSVQKSNLPEIPTIESSEEAQKIENGREQIRENAYQTILMLYQQRNVVEKQWKKVSTKDEEYDNKFNQYIANKQEIEKLSDTVKDLFDYASKIDDTTLKKVKKLRDSLGLMRFRPMPVQKSNNQSQKWIWPCYGKIVGEYGEKRSDHIHNGIDIAVPVGTPIKAIADGKVVVVGPSEGYGYWVGINHGFVNGIEVSSEYGHISKWVVSKGQYVKQGQIIAYSGNTGHSEGPHVHFTIRHGSPGKGGGKAVSPWDYIIRTKY